MKRLHWIVLRRLPGPFFGWLGTLMFLLLMQFLIRWLPEIAGKGIPLSVILELIVYNLAYMVVLAVPMSVLLAALMTYGGLAESQYYAVIKSTGISFAQLVWPSMIVALLVTGGMLYFNNVMLPEANHRARYLWKDIRTKRPGFELQPGVFYGGIDDYSILVQNRPDGTNQLEDVTIYDYTQGRDRQAVIKAARGEIAPDSTGRQMTLVLYDGEMHRSLPSSAGDPEPRYQRLSFDRHTLRLDLSDFVFQRSDADEDGGRSDRTMPTSEMLGHVDSLTIELEDDVSSLRGRLTEVLTPDTVLAQTTDRASVPTPSVSDADSEATDTLTADERAQAIAQDTTAWPTEYVALKGLSLTEQRSATSLAYTSARRLQSTVRNKSRTIEWKQKRIRGYRVEIYKKFSIATACLIFMFIGAPLGLSIRRGGLATIGAVALGIFMFYWITLVQGEKLADRGLLPPWVGMWIANILMLGLGSWLLTYVVMDLRATPPLRARLWKWLKGKE